MKHVIVSVPEEKYDFFVELMQRLDFVSQDDFSTVSEETKSIIRERKRTATKDSLKNWDEVKQHLKFE